MDNSVLAGIDLNKILDELATELGVELDDKPDINIDKDLLEEATNSFLYFCSCPFPFIDWVYVFRDLLNLPTSHLFTLTLNRIIKSTTPSDKIRPIAVKLFAEVQTIFPPLYPFIKSLTTNPNVSLVDKSLKDEAMVQRISNHPVHVKEDGGTISPSSFIPFCEIAGKMNLLGSKTEQFKEPVCDSFTPRVVVDQLCYEVDIQSKLKDLGGKKMGQILKSGVIFLLDYNEDREAIDENGDADEAEDKSLQFKVVGEDHLKSAKIFVDTLGHIS